MRIFDLRARARCPRSALGVPIDGSETPRLKPDHDLGRSPDSGWDAGGGQLLSCVFVPSTSIIFRSVLSPARISIRRGLASGATGIWMVSTPCS